MSEAKTHRNIRYAWRAAACVALAVSLNSCVPLLIAAAGVTVGYIARDEGIGQAPPLEGGGYRERKVETYDAPPAYEDDSGGGAGDYDLPVY